ncbi:MAG: DEAD/DEAH box helicase [Eubacteriaceae bacterium]|jgi:ATP-dependent RNA helicase DeaD|nr:DEAD/DEAH box helicase [Eubacteriaceae bacterium]
MKFNELEIQESLLRAIDSMGFEAMTDIQEQAIPILMEGKDLIGKSQTGTGKTMAFAIPAVENLDPQLRKPQILVLLPTRELALQVAEEFRKLLKYTHGYKVSAVYGGASIDNQIRELKGGAQIVVGTPGRVMDHMRRRTLRLDDLRMVVLDEADEMLNMGFREDIEVILKDVPTERQIALFSATMPQGILDIAKTFLRQPERIEISPKQMVAESIEQKYYQISDGDKFEALRRLIDVHKPRRALIFCNTKVYVDELTRKLQRAGYHADKIHGDMRQSARLTVLERFSEGSLNILVATDVAARGIDVEDIDIVFNYDVPDNEEYYVHRIGRTGRAGKQGLSLTLARSRDHYRLRKIADYTKEGIEKDLIPTGEVINEINISRFKEKMQSNFERSEGKDEIDSRYYAIVEDLKSRGLSPELVAATLIQRILPLDEGDDINIVGDRRKSRNRSDKDFRRKGRKSKFADGGSGKKVRFYLNIGEKDGARKRDILGAICGEAGISSALVGAIDMYNKFTFVDIDESVSKKVSRGLNKASLKGKRIRAEISKKRK